MMFKVGDRVRVKDGHYADYTPGSSYNFPRGAGTVADCGNGYVVVRYGGTVYPAANPLSFDLVAPTSGATSSAIRTVTRREIVPGEVGLPSGREIIVAPQGHYANIAIPSLAFDAIDLRAAASLFNELADVLDENAASDKVAA